jgi:predicted membrane protein
MTGPPPQYGEPPSDTPSTTGAHHRPSLGTILFGGLLILFGILWLLDRTGTLDLSWNALLPAILVLVGIALIVQSRSGSHDGLMTIGVILTVILTLSSLTDIKLHPSIGDREHRPTTIEQLETSYALGIGTLTLDLTALDFPAGDTEIEVSVGIGEIIVELPEGVAARVEWSVGVGDQKILGDDGSGGVGQDGVVTTPDFEASEQRVILKLSIGIGDIEVNQ